MPNLSIASINFAASGDNTLVTGIAGKIIQVFKIVFVVSAATALTFKDGTAGTALTGAMSMTANGALSFAYDTTPWFFASPGNNFVLNSGTAVQISGAIFYIQR